MRLSGKACIVTGAGRGIGRAVTLRLVREGASVLAVARSESDLKETAALAPGASGRCLAHPADVSERSQVEAAIDRCVHEFKRLDVLVNNAGVAPLGPVAGMSDDEFERLLAVNIRAVFYTCRSAWQALAATHGVIVNISSLAADDPFPGFAAYGASKAWVNTFTRALAQEGKSSGISVFTVAPGAVETSMLRGAFPGFPADQTLAPEDVAGVIAMLICDDSRPATGEIIHVKK